jgi:hypothetical protein
MMSTTLTLSDGRTIEAHPAADLFRMMSDAKIFGAPITGPKQLYSCTDPHDYSMSVNGNRRQQTAEEHRETIAAIGVSPGLLNNFLTERRGLNPASAARLRQYLAEQP